MKITAITDSDTALAFRLAGIDTLIPPRPENTANLLKEVAGRPDIGIVLITERLAKAARKEIEKISHERHLPLFMEIPDMKGPLGKRLSATERMAAIIRR